MKKYKFFIILFFVIVFLFGLVSFFLPKNSGKGEKIVFSIEKGDGSKEIALSLEKSGIIRWGPIFRVYVLITGKSKKMQAGDYEISQSMNVSQIAGKFFRGDVIKDKITIIEGWNLRNIKVYFEEKGILGEKGFWDLTGMPAMDYSDYETKPEDFSSEYNFLKDKPKNLSLEGYLFPDTYEINKGIDRGEVIKIILKNFGQKIVLYKDEISGSKKTIFEIITMASMIEKEVRTKEDKELVSGILWKRLKIGMPLQVDATVSYITGEKGVKISIEDTKMDSPYNTYKYNGLPLGPICNPGLESIKAAIYPKSSDYLYYLSTPEGETIFSRTLEEHNIAKAEYLK